MAQTLTTATVGNPTRALAWMVGALASFSTVAVAGREAGEAMAAAAGRDSPALIDTVQIMFVRSVVGLVIAAALVAVSRQGFALIATPKLRIHSVRNTVHFAAQFSWLHALTLIPLAQLFAIEFTAPLWVAVMAPLVLKESLTPVRVAAAALGFAGVLVIVGPQVSGIGLGSALALLASLGFAGSMIATKALMRHDTALSILFHMSWMQTVMAGIIAAPYLTVPTPEFLFWACIVGICGLSAHYCLARAFGEADAIIVAPMDFLRLPLITAIGALLYGESLELAVLMGGLVVIAGNVINLVGERRRARA